MSVSAGPQVHVCWGLQPQTLLMMQAAGGQGSPTLIESGHVVVLSHPAAANTVKNPRIIRTTDLLRFLVRDLSDA